MAKTVSLTKPFDPEFDAIARRRDMARALYNQSQTTSPVNEMAGGYVIRRSPLEGVAKLGKQALGILVDRQADEEQRALTESKNSRLAETLNKFQQLSSSAVPDRTGAIGTLIQSGIPELQQMGLQEQLQDLQRQPELQMRREEAKANREQRMQELTLRLQDARTSAQDRANLQRELAQMRIDSQTMGSNKPYFTPVQTADGVVSFDTRTGRAAPVAIGDRQIIGSQSDPNLQGRIAGAKAYSKEKAEGMAKSQQGLQKILDNATAATQQIDDLLKHPGFESTVGATLLPGARFIEGSPQASFMARLNQVKGGAFLQAYDALRGAGQITEVEGQKATQAIARLDKAQSEKEFMAAAEEFKAIINKGVQRAKSSAGMPSSKAGALMPNPDGSFNYVPRQ